MQSCVFCDIIAYTSPAFIIHEAGATIAFLDTHPSAPGHTLVLLKKHGRTILDYAPKELNKLWSAVQRVVRKLEKAFQTNSLTIGINHGEVAGVHHLHVHLIPRFPADGGGIIQSVISSHPTESLTSIWEKILQNGV